MKTRAFIDWLSITWPGQPWLDAVNDPTHPRHKTWVNDYSTDRTKFVETKPQFGYERGFKSDCGTLVLAGSREDMGIHFSYSGEALANLITPIDDPLTLLKWHNKADARATRVDIAVDVIDCKELSVQAIADYHRLGQTQTQATKFTRMTSEDGGDTLYIGSRASERYMRIYNKLAERAGRALDDVYDSWLRIELELKGERAANFLLAACLPDANLTSLIVSWLRGFFDIPQFELWRLALSGELTAITPSRRKASDTRNWLLNTIVPIMAKETGHDPRLLATMLLELLEQLYNQDSLPAVNTGVDTGELSS